MQLILPCKVHILLRFIIFVSFVDCWVLKVVNGSYMTFMKSSDFMKCCDFYEKLRLLRKVVTFSKDCDFFKGLGPF